MRSLKIILLLVVLFLSNFVASAGDSERVEVKSGENVTLSVKKPGNVMRLTLQNCENKAEDPIIRYCTPEEEKKGCTAKKSDRFSINFDTEYFNVTLVGATASDEGCYVVSYIDVDNNEKKKWFNVTVIGSPKNGKETSRTISLGYLIIIAVGIVLLTAVVI